MIKKIYRITSLILAILIAQPQPLHAHQHRADLPAGAIRQAGSREHSEKIETKDQRPKTQDPNQKSLQSRSEKGGQASVPGLRPEEERSVLSSLPHAVSIPSELGVIDESHYALCSMPSACPAIIYIQDAHDSLEAQENIAKIIQHLVAKYEIKTVFEEGYEGPVPSDEYFGWIKDPELKRKAAYFLMDHLRLGGADYAHVIRQRAESIAQRVKTQNEPYALSAMRSADFRLVGADNLKLHKQNRLWYEKAAKRRAANQKQLNLLQKEIKDLVNRHFSPEAKEWMKLRTLYLQGKLGVLDYVRRIKQTIPARQSEAAGGDQRLKTKDQNSDGTRYLLQQKVPGTIGATIRPAKLFREVRRLEDETARGLFSSERDQKIFQYARDLELFHKLNQIKLSAEEYEAVSESLKNFDTQKMAQFIVSQSKKIAVLPKRWKQSIQPAIQFYETARLREKAIEKMLKSEMMKRRNDEMTKGRNDDGAEKKKSSSRPFVDSSILVFGGFHKEGIKDILKHLGYSYVIVTPRITAVSPVHQKRYLKLMSRGHYDFETPFLRFAASPEKIYRVMPALQMAGWAQKSFRPLVEDAPPVRNERSELRFPESKTLHEVIGDVLIRDRVHETPFFVRSFGQLKEGLSWETPRLTQMPDVLNEAFRLLKERFEKNPKKSNAENFMISNFKIFEEHPVFVVSAKHFGKIVQIRYHDQDSRRTYWVVVNERFFERLENSYVASLFLSYQLARALDQVLLDQFSREWNVKLGDLDKECILIHRDLTRLHLRPSDRQEILNFLKDKSGKSRFFDPGSKYQKLLNEDNFFELGNDHRPAWLHMISRFVIRHSPFRMDQAGELSRKARDILFNRFEDYLNLKRWYENHLKYWQGQPVRILDPDSQVTFVYESIPESRQSGFIGLLKQEDFLNDSLRHIYGEAAYELWTRDIHKVNLTRDFEKVYVREKGYGAVKIVYHILLVPRDTNRFSRPLEFLIMLYNPNGTIHDFSGPPHTREPWTGREIYWLRRINHHEANLVPKLGVVSAGSKALFEELDSDSGKLVKIPVTSIENAGSNVQKLLDSNSISIAGKKSLLRYAMSKYGRLLLRYGGLVSIADPHLKNITSKEFRLKVVDHGSLALWGEEYSIDYLDFSRLLGFAMSTWELPEAPKFPEHWAHEDWEHIQNLWEQAKPDLDVHPSHFFGTGAPTHSDDFTLKQSNHAQDFALLQSILMQEGSINEGAIRFVKSLTHKYKQYAIGAHHLHDYQKEIPYLAGTYEEWCQTLQKLYHETYDKSYLLEGLLDIYTRSYKDSELSYLERLQAGVDLLAHLAQNLFNNLTPNQEKFVRDYFDQLRQNPKSYAVPQGISSRPPVRNVHWEEIQSKWQNILDRWEDRFSKDYGEETGISDFAIPSNQFHLLGRRMDQLTPTETINFLSGLRDSFYTPSVPVLALLRYMHSKLTPGKEVPAVLLKRRDYKHWIQSMIRAAQIARSEVREAENASGWKLVLDQMHLNPEQDRMLESTFNELKAAKVPLHELKYGASLIALIYGGGAADSKQFKKVNLGLMKLFQSNEDVSIRPLLLQGKNEITRSRGLVNDLWGWTQNKIGSNSYYFLFLPLVFVFLELLVGALIVSRVSAAEILFVVLVYRLINSYFQRQVFLESWRLPLDREAVLRILRASDIITWEVFDAMIRVRYLRPDKETDLAFVIRQAPSGVLVFSPATISFRILFDETKDKFYFQDKPGAPLKEIHPLEPFFKSAGVQVEFAENNRLKLILLKSGERFQTLAVVKASPMMGSEVQVLSQEPDIQIPSESELLESDQTVVKNVAVELANENIDPKIIQKFEAFAVSQFTKPRIDSSLYFFWIKTALLERDWGLLDSSFWSWAGRPKLKRESLTMLARYVAPREVTREMFQRITDGGGVKKRSELRSKLWRPNQEAHFVLNGQNFLWEGAENIFKNIYAKIYTIERKGIPLYLEPEESTPPRYMKNQRSKPRILNPAVETLIPEKADIEEAGAIYDRHSDLPDSHHLHVLIESAKKKATVRNHNNTYTGYVDFYESEFKKHLGDIRLTPGAKEFLEQLHRMKYPQNYPVKVVLLTNAFKFVAEAIVEHFQLRHVFDEVIGSWRIREVEHDKAQQLISYSIRHHHPLLIVGGDSLQDMQAVHVARQSSTRTNPLHAVGFVVSKQVDVISKFSNSGAFGWMRSLEDFPKLLNYLQSQTDESLLLRTPENPVEISPRSELRNDEIQKEVRELLARMELSPSRSPASVTGQNLKAESWFTPSTAPHGLPTIKLSVSRKEGGLVPQLEKTGIHLLNINGSAEERRIEFKRLDRYGSVTFTEKDSFQTYRFELGERSEVRVPQSAVFKLKSRVNPRHLAPIFVLSASSVAGLKPEEWRELVALKATHRDLQIQILDDASEALSDRVRELLQFPKVLFGAQKFQRPGEMVIGFGSEKGDSVKAGSSFLGHNPRIVKFKIYPGAFVTALRLSQSNGVLPGLYNDQGWLSDPENVYAAASLDRLFRSVEIVTQSA